MKMPMNMWGMLLCSDSRVPELKQSECESECGESRVRVPHQAEGESERERLEPTAAHEQLQGVLFEGLDGYNKRAK